ncbi:hypothetical protein HW555_008530, partial [Spodoptera exigua]
MDLEEIGLARFWVLLECLSPYFVQVLTETTISDQHLREPERDAFLSLQPGIEVRQNGFDNAPVVIARRQSLQRFIVEEGAKPYVFFFL